MTPREPTEFDRVLRDTVDLTDASKWPPHLVVPEKDDWVFVAEYPERNVPVRGPVRFWVAAKERSDADPFILEHGRGAGLGVRYFVRYENGEFRVLLMRREMTVARFFTHLVDGGLKDLHRAIAGLSQFQHIDAGIGVRLRSS